MQNTSEARVEGWDWLSSGNRYIDVSPSCNHFFCLSESSCPITEIMALTDIIPDPPTSPRPPETPPCSPRCPPPDSSGAHVLARVETVDRLEQALMKLVQVLEKVNGTTKREGAKPEATKLVEAEKPKIRASKLDYKLVDEVYVTMSIVTVSLTIPA
jgi:hypothetical protein